MRKWIFSLCILTTLFFLPYMASSSFVKTKIENHLSSQLGGCVAIEEIHFQWFGWQKCKNVTWEHKEKTAFSRAESIQFKMTPLSWLQIRKKPLDVTILGANLSSEAKLKFLKKNKNLEMRFDPIYAKIGKGSIVLEKTMVYIRSSMTASISGTIDIHSSHLDLTMGLGEKALRKIFKTQNLPKDYVLEIPLRSKMKASSIERRLLKALMNNYATVMSSQR